MPYISWPISYLPTHPISPLTSHLGPYILSTYPPYIMVIGSYFTAWLGVNSNPHTRHGPNSPWQRLSGRGKCSYFCRKFREIERNLGLEGLCHGKSLCDSVGWLFLACDKGPIMWYHIRWNHLQTLYYFDVQVSMIIFIMLKNIKIHCN